MSVFKLTTEIIALSVAKTWDEAKLEWQLEDVTKEEEPSTCLCGHFPVLELCTLRNTKNQKSAVVGNCCVKKFIGLPSEKIFQAVSRVQKDWWRALNAETIDHAHKKRWITDWERDFYFDTMRKRIAGMSSKQSGKRYEINQRVLKHIIRTNETRG
jgi:hypothetical protein